MAYKNLVAQACTGKADWFIRFRDFLCARNVVYDYSTSGIGWTLHDSSYAVDESNPQLGDWIVVFSAGESGKETLYYKFEWGTNDIIVLGYSYWDNSAHTGTNWYGLTTGSLAIDETGASYDIYVSGDLDFAHVWETLEDTNDSAAMFGKLEDDVYDTTPAICSSPLTAGSDVSVLLDSVPVSWIAGTTSVMVRFQDTVERAIVKTIISNTITIDLVNSYSANAVFAESVPYILTNSNTIMLIAKCLYNHTGGDAGYALSAPVLPVSNASLDPDLMYSDYILFSIYMSSVDNEVGWCGRVPNMFTRPVALSEKTSHSDGTDTYRILKDYTSQYLAVREV